MTGIGGIGGGEFPKEEKMNIEKDVSKKRTLSGRTVSVNSKVKKHGSLQLLSDAKSSFVGIEINKKDVAGTVHSLLQEVERQSGLKKPGQIVGVFLNKAGDKYNVKTFQVSDKDQQAEVMKRVTNVNLFKLVSTVTDTDLQKNLKNTIEEVFLEIGQTTDRTDALQQVLYSSFDLEKNPPSLESLLAEPDQQYLKTLLRNNLGAVRELVQSHPELLRRKEINPEFLNDKELMFIAVQKDPSCVLLVGDALKKNPSVYARLLLTSLSSFALGKHDKGIQDKQKEVEKIAEQFFPKEGISFEDIIGHIFNLFESRLGGRCTQQDRDQSVQALESACAKVSYKDWKEAIQEIQSGECTSPQAMILAGTIRHPLYYEEIKPQPRIPGPPPTLIVSLLNSSDKQVARWAKEKNPEFLLYMDSAIKQDSEFKETYLQIVQEMILGSEHVERGDPSLVSDYRFPVELFQNEKFMKALEQKDPEAFRFASDKAKELFQKK